MKAEGPTTHIDLTNATRSTTQRRLRWCLHALLALICYGFMLYVGLRLRTWHWSFTEPIHYVADMSNSMRWGQRAAAEGYLNLYETVIQEHPRADYGLDYPPLRLAVVAVWGHWLAHYYPEVHAASQSFDFNWPFLRFNTLMELASTVAVFLLVRMWLPETRDGQSPGYWKGWLLPSIAAAWFWFNPAVWISTCGRPAGDIWIVPFYLLAIWLACKEYWFIAGVTVGVGAMLKGQQLIVAPLFILWPLFRGRIGPPVRWLCGLFVGVAAVVSPWMITYRTSGATIQRTADWPAILWILGILAGMVSVLVAARRRPALPYKYIALLCLLAMGSAIWPSLLHFDWVWVVILMLGSMILSAILLKACIATKATAISAALAASLLLCMCFFHGSTAWYRIGFQYGVDKFPGLITGESSSLAGILERRYHWRSTDTAIELPTHALGFWPSQPTPVDLRTTMGVLVALGLVLSALALALQQRRRSRFFLIAVATPWLLYFALAPQMHERYLLWGASACACSVVLGLDWFLLGTLVSVLSWMMTIMILLQAGGRVRASHHWLGDAGDRLSNCIAHTYPDIGWMVILCALIYLYNGLRNNGAGTMPTIACSV